MQHVIYGIAEEDVRTARTQRKTGPHYKLQGI